jgi:hypothetical protein
MAMEVKHIKKHGPPLLLVLGGFFALSLLTLGQVQTGKLNSDSSLAQGLVTRVIDIRPTANGLGHVSISQALKPAEKTGPLSVTEQSGQGFSLTFELSE